MRLESVPVPVPAADQIVVRVAVASVNPVDWKIREGWLANAFPMALPMTLGRDAVGTVAAVGSAVAAFVIGDEVVGNTAPGTDGTHAEFVALPAAACARKPRTVSMRDAAACLGIAGLSAYIPLVEDAQISPGQRILIHAGAGGVGSLGIQMAKRAGAYVIATCGPANLEFVRSIGADHVIDYTRSSFERDEQVAGRCDVVFDSIGGDIHNRSFAALKAGGVMVALAAAPIPAVERRADVRVHQSSIRATRERWERLFAMVGDGTLKPIIAKTLRFEDLPAGYALSQAGHTRGKILIEL